MTEHQCPDCPLRFPTVEAWQRHNMYMHFAVRPPHRADHAEYGRRMQPAGDESTRTGLDAPPALA